MIRILYFGFLKETLGRSEEQFPWSGADSTELLQQLRCRGTEWQKALAEENIFRLVVNQHIIYSPIFIHPGDEVAILPPVTGG